MYNHCRTCSVVVDLLFYVPSIFVEVLRSSLFWYALHYVLSSFPIILTRKRALKFAFIVFRMSCYRKCPVALPHDAAGGPAVCDCGIS